MSTSYSSSQVAALPTGPYAVSKTMSRAGLNVVRRNPIKTLLYVLGVMVCALFNGITAPPEVEDAYHEALQQLDAKYGNDLRDAHSNWVIKFFKIFHSSHSTFLN